MNQEYKVKTVGFEGPLALLLNLIEKRKLFINDIALAQVTVGYLDYLNQAETGGTVVMSSMADFLVIASTLVLIKSRSLLPGLPITQEEEEDIEQLKQRLILYKDIRDKCKYIHDAFGKDIIFQGGLKTAIEPTFSPSKEITVAALLYSIKNVLALLPKLQNIPQAVVKKIVSLEETIKALSERVQKNLKMSFGQFAKIKNKSKEEIMSIKSDVIVSFLAVLELVKRGIILVNQQKHFEDINMESANYRVPQY